VKKMDDRRKKEKKCYSCGGKLTEVHGETLAVFIECAKCRIIVGSYVKKRRDDKIAEN
jgi:hypothetical protein